MSLSPVEWSHAQKLLCQLVDALSPLATRPEQTYFSPSLRIFIPPQLENPQSLQVRNPVRILLTLQKQVHDLAGIEEGEGKVVQTKAQTDNTNHPTATIEKQAKSLITQVQDAIGKLASSTNLQNPKEEPLRETMQKLKPKLDQIIQAVAEKGESELVQKPTQSFARSERETRLIEALMKPRIEREIFKEFIPQKAKVLEEITSLEIAPLTTRSEVKEMKPREKSPINPPLLQPAERKEKTADSLPQKEASQQEAIGRPFEKEEIAKISRPSKPVPVIQEGLISQTKEQASARPIDKPAIPLVPFVAENRSLTPVRKKKKKKGFWKSEQDDDDRKDS